MIGIPFVMVAVVLFVRLRSVVLSQLECESWYDEYMRKYLKHMRSLESKSKSRKAKKPIDV